MKRIILVLVLLYLLVGCDTVENDNSNVRAFGVAKIEDIQINGNQIIVTTVYGTLTPCWYYYKTEMTNNGIVFTSKVFGKDDSDACIEVLDSFTREEKISFFSKGEKTLRFWQNDSVYLDTTIILQ